MFTCGSGSSLLSLCAAFRQLRWRATERMSILKKRIKKHGALVSHQKATAMACGCQKCSARASKLSVHGAPSTPSFRAVLEGRLANRPLCQVITGTEAQRQTRAKLEYCMGEACKLRLQARLATAKTLVLHSDARKHRLTLRYRCVSGCLNAGHGRLPWACQPLPGEDREPGVCGLCGGRRETHLPGCMHKVPGPVQSFFCQATTWFKQTRGCYKSGLMPCLGA